MIISHKYKYAFIQLDKTASTAIAKELVENYAGEPILWKHARYEDFMRTATPEEKKYFIFSGIRNPMDVAVSSYYYRKIGHSKEDALNNKKYLYIKENDATFADYFKKFSAKNIRHEWKTNFFYKLDYVYRYEKIQEDFSKILKILKIEQKRPIPLFNKTTEKNNPYESYFTPEIQGLAKIVFGNLMSKWGYKFPDGWAEPSLKEKYVFAPFLHVKFFMQKIAHLIIDHPLIYKKYYGIKNENSYLS